MLCGGEVEGAGAGIYLPGLLHQCVGAYTVSRHLSPKLKSPRGTNISGGLCDVLCQVVTLVLALGRVIKLEHLLLPG